jgi:3-deoxy-D-manno-octulosonic-acid transferase
MYFLYRTLTWIALAAAPFYALGAIIRRPSERHTVAHRLGLQSTALLDHGRGGIWIQAASVGELQIAALLAPRLSSVTGSLPICLSVTTSAARRLATPPPAGVQIAMTIPLDLPLVASRVVRTLSPRLFIAVETELWPNLYGALQRRRIPIALVNGRISDTSLRRYRRVPGLVARTLDAVHLVCARSEEDARRFVSLGLDSRRVHVTGDLKFDRPAPSPGRLERVLGHLLTGRRVLVAGSTHAGEEAAALEAGRQAVAAGRRVTVILAPRHLGRLTQVRDLLEEAGVTWSLRSQVDGSVAADDALQVILLDTHGELAGLYPLAHVAFLGGTLATVGGHNPLEAAAAGIPQVSGPHLDNLRDTAGLLQETGALLTTRDAASATASMAELLADPQAAATRGKAAAAFLGRQRGALDRTVTAVAGLLARVPGGTEL